mmetsp:Transcript_72616/g.117776  ORF Transcript_72616/g.117776 Transcript_72616/m.117776 type:complete len:130 (+) Transcript_72616:39-428(+)
MLRSVVAVLCIAAASAFSPAALPLRARQTSSSAPMCAMQGPVANLGKAAIAASLLFNMAGPVAPAFADVAANPYAKAGELEAAKKATEVKNEKSNPALIAIPLVLMVVLSVPFYKRNLERMAEKAGGKR